MSLITFSFRRLVPGFLLVAALLAGCKKSQKPEATAAEDDAPTAEEAAQPPADLRLRWQAGQRYDQRMEMVQTSASFAPGAPRAVEQTVTLHQEYQFTPLAARAGGGHDIELVFGHLDTRFVMNGSPLMDLDTRQTNARNDATAEAMRSVVGKRLVFGLNDSNRVESLTGMAELREATLGPAPQHLRGLLDSAFSEDTYKQLLERTHSWPQSPVKVGTRWPQRTEINYGPMGTLVLDLKYTFRRWEDHDGRRVALIEYAGPVTSRSGTEPAPMGIRSEVSEGRATGKIWFDPELGQPRDSRSEQNLTILLTLPPRPARQIEGRTNTPPPTAQVVTNRLNQKLTLTLTGAKPATP